MGLLSPDQEFKNFCFYPKSIHRWIKGDDEGNEDVVKNISGGFVIYESDRRCNLELIHEFMTPIFDGPDPSIEAERKFREMSAGLSYEEITPEQIAAAKSNSEPVLQNNVQQETIAQIPVVEVKKYSGSPVKLVLESQTDEISATTVINVPIKIPSKEIVNVLKKSFPDINVQDVILEIITSKFDQKTINEMINNSLTDFLKDTYSSENI